MGEQILQFLSSGKACVDFKENRRFYVKLEILVFFLNIVLSFHANRVFNFPCKLTLLAKAFCFLDLHVQTLAAASVGEHKTAHFF